MSYLSLFGLGNTLANATGGGQTSANDNTATDPVGGSSGFGDPWGSWNPSPASSFEPAPEPSIFDGPQQSEESGFGSGLGYDFGYDFNPEAPEPLLRHEPIDFEIEVPELGVDYDIPIPAYSEVLPGHIVELVDTYEQSQFLERLDFSGHGQGIPTGATDVAVRDQAEFLGSLRADQIENIKNNAPGLLVGMDATPWRTRSEATNNLFKERIGFLTDQRRFHARRYERFRGDFDKTKSQFEQNAMRMIDEERTLLGHWVDDPTRTFLKYDPRVGVAELFGNLDSADHVLTLVGGVTNTLKNYDRTTPLYKQDGESTRLYAESIYGQSLQHQDDLGEFAVVAWQDYKAPYAVVFPSASRPRLARNGAEDLARYAEGLELGTEKNLNHMVLGHSYGSTVTGIGIEEYGLGEHIDAAYFVGSPGVAARDMAELGQNGYAVPELFAQISRDDPIRMVPRQVHGLQPTNPEFGIPEGNIRFTDGLKHSGYMTDREAIRDILEAIAHHQGS